MIKEKPFPRHEEAIAISIGLAEDIHKLSKTLPEEEDMVMVPQIRETVMNLQKAVFMTGHSKDSEDFYYYTGEARGKAAVLVTLVEISKNLGYCSVEIYEKLVDDIDRIGKLIEPPAKPQLSVVK